MKKYTAFWIAAWLSLFAMTNFPVLAEEGIPPECRLLPDHRAQSDVAYQPGVDARGKPVVPADINASPIGKDTVIVPLTVDLAQRLQNQNIAGVELKGTLGFLEIAPSGRVTYNGQDMTSQVYALCGEKPQETQPSAASEADRQNPPDVIESGPVKEIAPVQATPPVTVDSQTK